MRALFCVSVAVNLPGKFYNIQTSPGSVSVWATPCPVDTYSPGLKKQRSCGLVPQASVFAATKPLSSWLHDSPLIAFLLHPALLGFP